jgi:hypothetical protein
MNTPTASPDIPSPRKYADRYNFEKTPRREPERSVYLQAQAEEAVRAEQAMTPPNRRRVGKSRSAPPSAIKMAARAKYSIGDLEGYKLWWTKLPVSIFNKKKEASYTLKKGGTSKRKKKKKDCLNVMLNICLFQEPQTPPTPGAAYSCQWSEKQLPPGFIHPLAIRPQPVYRNTNSPKYYKTPERGSNCSMTPGLPTPEGTMTPEESLGSPISMTGCDMGSQLSIPDEYLRDLTQQVIII